MFLLLRSLHPCFGAEVSGVDLAQPLGAGDFGAIRDAFNEHAVLVFPGQSLDDEQQVAFSQRFGPLDPGIAKDGALCDAADQLWHSDGSFKRVPAMASLLHAREVPPRGGETEFADMRAAWEALPAADRRGLEGLVVEHSLFYSRRLIGDDRFTESERAAAPPVPQALVRTHLVTGKKSLYLGSHASHILGRPVEEGRAVLRALLEFATASRFVLRHAWRVGDLVMWDNRRVLHRGRPWDEARHRRVMHRTTVAGDGPTVSDEDVARSIASPGR